MAYTLKTTGLPSRYPGKIRSCIIVNQAGTGLIDLVSGNTLVVAPEVTIGTGSWNGSSRAFFNITGSGANIRGVGYSGTLPELEFGWGASAFFAMNSLGANGGGNNTGSVTQFDNGPIIELGNGGKVSWNIAAGRLYTSTADAITAKGSIHVRMAETGALDAQQAVHGSSLASMGGSGTAAGFLGSDSVGTPIEWGGIDSYDWKEISPYMILLTEGPISDSDAQLLHTDWFSEMVEVTGGSTVSVTAGGLSSGVLFGTAVVTRRTTTTLSPGGIASTGAFGTAVLTATMPLAGFTTPPLKNKSGTLLAGETGVVVNVYNATTGALIVRKTGLSSNGSGLVTVSDASLVAGTTYAYEVVLSSNGRRLPTVLAA